MNNNFNQVVEEAKEYFIVNMEETFVCWNDERGYFYCNGKTLAIVNVRDNDKRLNPKVMGSWNYSLTTFSQEGKAFRTGQKYYELRKVA